MNQPENESSKRFKIVTLGCRTNQYEAQAYRDQLTAMGYEAASDDETASICIVNTCSVTESATKQSRNEIEKLNSAHPLAQLVVTGCAAEHYPKAFNALPGVTHMISNKEKEELIAKVFPEQSAPEFAIRHFEAHTRAFVKVQDGCNSFCTYCIIPYVRGRSRSRSMEEILREVRGLIENGFKEIVLTGINIGDFDGGDEDKPVRLSELVRAIDMLPGLERLRLSSIDPDEVDDDLAEAILNGKNTCPSMHLVLQSGSNVILKRMNRKYTRQIFLEAVERLKHRNPDFTITTDVIVGFPGESEADFAETLSVINQVRFAKVHMFPFSPRERTKAALMPNQVPKEIIKERKQRILRAAEHSCFTLCEEYVGRSMKVLLEGRDAAEGSTNTLLMGHTENFLPVWVEGKGLKPNDIILVDLIENHANGLKGCLRNH